MEKVFFVNTITGNFSASFPAGDLKLITPEDLAKINEQNPGTKLIKYECINDATFEFSQWFKLK